MGVLKAIKAVFSCLGKIAQYFTNRDLIDAGKDAERRKRAEEGLKDAKKVKNTKKDVDNLTPEQLRDELRNSNKGKK